jgi:ferredoxin
MVKERFTLVFAADSYAKPITYHLIKDFDLKINILRAEITPGEEGHLLVEAEGEEDDLRDALAFLAAEQIEVIPTNRQVKVREEACVHCGACTAVCFSGALAMNGGDWRLEFSPDKCIVCGLCIDACPLKAIAIVFGKSDES